MVLAFGSDGSSGEKASRYRSRVLTEGSVPVSVAGKTVRTVPVSGSGSVAGPF